MTSIASSLLFGLIPAWQLSRTDLRSALNEETRGGSGRRTGHLLVAAELALAFSVLVGAGLLVRSFARVTAVDPGFGVDHRLTLRVSLPVARYRDAPQRAAFYAQLFERLAALPGVRAAGGVSELPLGDLRNMGTFEIDGRPTPRGADQPHADWRSASPRYFNAIGLGLVAGRLFEERDGADAPRVAIIDEAAASRYWAGENPIGQRLTTDGTEPDGHLARDRRRRPHRASRLARHGAARHGVLSAGAARDHVDLRRAAHDGDPLGGPAVGAVRRFARWTRRCRCSTRARSTIVSDNRLAAGASPPG